LFSYELETVCRFSLSGLTEFGYNLDADWS